MKLENLLYPTNIHCKNINDTTIKVSLEPLERGFGYTLGFSFKKVMLQGLSGAALTKVKINDGISNHKVKLPCLESISELLLNLQSLQLKLDNEVMKESFTISISGKCRDIYAYDLDIPNSIEILNPQILICHYQGKQKFMLQLEVQEGIGYQDAEVAFNDGFYLLDVLFSPVIFCNYNVENARVGQNTDLDRLIFDVKTNGAITPIDAFNQAAHKIQKSMSGIVDENEIVKRIPVEEQNEIDPFLLKRVEELDLTVRSANCLKSENLDYIGELVQKKESDLMRTPNFGKKSLLEIKEKLALYKYSLGTTIKNWTKTLP